MTKKSRRNRSNELGTSKCDQDDRPLISRDNLIAAVTLVVIAYIALPLFTDVRVAPMDTNPKQSHVPIFTQQDFKKSSADIIEERLLEEWQPGDFVTIKSIDEGNRGLFATKDIRKGQVMVRVQIPDLEAEITRDYPTLKPLVDSALTKAVQHYGARSTHTSGKVLALIKFLLEDSKGEDSIWESYIKAIPSNVTNMVWYWSDEEKQCIVARPHSNTIHQDRAVFHNVIDEVKDKFAPLQQIYNRERVEWAYLMLKTRGFGKYFQPIADFANHQPLEAVPLFRIPKEDSALLVAAKDVKKGEQIFNNYGNLSPLQTSEQYGFVDPASAYIEVPSILEDLLHSERTKNERLCNSEPVRFFGSVPTKEISAKYRSAGHSTYFKAFMPDERSYACIRVLLQTERDTDVAAYIAEKIEIDYARYKAMAEAPHCQSSDGNYPLIRQANEVMARLLWGALEVAQQGKDFKIPYPGIPTYTMNYS